MKRFGLLIYCILCSLSSRAFEPTGNYAPRQLEGWFILVSPQVATNSSLATNVLRLLEFQLYQITRAVPEPALTRLREVPIWIELNDSSFPGMCYHPSRDWLREHGFNPDKARAVEIGNATNFLTWTHEQPWMVLHELAHSYHDRVLGYNYSPIKAAYEHAKASKTYDNVLYIGGGRKRHYALTDNQEYFAECTEAFFGVNDFYPFVRVELRECDPDMFVLLEKVWGLKE